MSRRLLAGYLSLTLIILAILEIPLGLSFARTERQNLTALVERDAVSLAAFAEQAMPPAPAPEVEKLRRTVSDYLRQTGARVVVVDEAGIAVVDADPPEVGQRRFLTRPEIAAALAGDVETGTRRSDTLGGSFLYVAGPIHSEGEVCGVVRITYPTAAIDARVRRYWLMLAAIAAVALGVCSVVALRFSRATSRPLRGLERAAEAAGGGDLTVRAQVDGPPEVRALATRFNEMVQRLAELRHAQDAFVADASHQLRTPLAAFRLELEHLEREVVGTARERLRRVDAEAARLGQLVNGLLALARADALQPVAAVVDVSAAIEERVDVWSVVAEERGIDLAGQAPAGLAARATPASLEQALDNLIENALVYTPEGSAVTVTATLAGEIAEVRVIDSGPGLTDTQKARAFDRFWRAGAGGDGSGLGLAIVRRLVEADGGTVELLDAPGGGLQAVLRLPAARAAPRPRPGRRLSLSR
ncbi:MAG: ATP-binding protein [Thermoleophilia bacterium]